MVCDRGYGQAFRIQRSTIATTPIPPAVQIEISARPDPFSFSSFAAVARVRKDGGGYERLADTGSSSVAVDDIAYYYGGIIRGCK